MGGEPGEELSTVSTSFPPASPDGAVLSVRGRSGKGGSLRVPGALGVTISIGKAAGNELVIDDPTVSRRHATVCRTTAGIVVADLESTNGTFVGTTRIREAVVEPGTIVRVGDVEVLVAVELGDVVIPPSEHDSFGIALGSSLEMRRIFGILERIAPTSASVLLLGETGTGKDVLARSIHLQSKREGGPFEVVDLGAISASLIESELFGHERGAFTGAVSARAGAFERAAGGTIFLDEIGELALDLQPKLLRVLEAREFRRLGGQKVLAADVRVVAATTRDLEAEVARGTFRQDLYFRLAVVPIRVPPLRERPDDIPLLASRLLASLGTDLQLPPAALAALRAHEWRGNVRELRNVVERAVHLSMAVGSPTLRLDNMPPRTDQATPGDLERLEFDEAASYRETRARYDAAFERRYVSWLLERFRGNISAAARDARMDRTHLSELARKHGLDGKR